MQYLDEIEAVVIRLYEDGADDPAAIDLLDRVIANIRRKHETYETRLEEIWRLMH